MSETTIAWTDCTWNPVRGCSRVSEGCRNCYAERMAARNLPEMRSPVTGEPYAFSTPSGPRWTGKVELIQSKLDEPLRWRKPRKVFVDSMSDLFHGALPFDHITAVYGVMAAAMDHTFQVLTKRPARRVAWSEWLRGKGGLGRYIRSDEGRNALRGFYAEGSRIEVYRGCTYRSVKDAWAMVMNSAACLGGLGAGPLPNVWEGVSVENQKTADERTPILLQTPAAVRFLSLEPMLGPVQFRPSWVAGYDYRGGLKVAAPRLDLVIVGGESGPGARPMHPDWPLSVRNQCRQAGVPFFMKQRGAWCAQSWGAKATGSKKWGTLTADGSWFPETTPWNGRRLDDSPEREEVMVHAGGHGGDPAEWPEDLRVREFPR